MQFKYPEVFYFLLLLLIPIIVHLFQLQKFKKIPFTNVAFLQKISLQTRKSSKLKKWLILTTRILGLLALLFTFSQPYFSNRKADQKSHNIIYLDNSISLNTNGRTGNQLKKVAQEIIENAPLSETYTLITNDDVYDNISKKELDNYLKNSEYSYSNSSLDEKLLKFEELNKNKTNSLNKNILISDLQNIKENKFTNVNTSISLIKPEISSQNNISIDSVSIFNSASDKINVSVFVKNQGDKKNNIPIALYNKEQLINKRSFSIEKNQNKKLDFSIPKNTFFDGKIQVTYNDIFLFDNVFYFHMSNRKKAAVLSIGEASEPLSKIYTNEDFIFQNSPLQNVNYNSIPNQQLIVLNELKSIPQVLQNTLIDYLKNGGHLFVIPDAQIDIASYNAFFNKLTNGNIINRKRDSLQITKINFDHPIYQNVFSKKVRNFQSPETAVSYSSNFKGADIVEYEDTTPFLQEISNPFSKVYWLSSPLNSRFTNFSNSPLIVPTLYNIGQQSLEIAKPYYIIKQSNTIEIKEKLGKDQVLSIANKNGSFIPLQQSFSNKVQVVTDNQPDAPGFYQILSKQDTLETLAFNVSKKESLLEFYDVSSTKNENSNITVYSSVKDLFTEIKQKNEVQWLWKLFLAIAIVSLLLEILILKFFRT